MAEVEQYSQFTQGCLFKSDVFVFAVRLSFFFKKALVILNYEMVHLALKANCDLLPSHL